MVRGCSPVRELRDVLDLACVGLHATQSQVFALEDQPGERDRSIWRHPGPPESDVDVEQHVQPEARIANNAVKQPDARRTVDDCHERRRSLEESHESSGRVPGGYRSRDQHVHHASIDQGFGLGDFGRTDAEGAVGELQLGQRRALVGLCVRSQPLARSLDPRLHLAHVLLENFEVDHKARSVEVPFVHADHIHAGLVHPGILPFLRIRRHGAGPATVYSACDRSPAPPPVSCDLHGRC